MYTTVDLLQARDQGKIAAHDRDFADSLLNQAKHRALSERQRMFVDRLVKKAKGEDERATVDVGDLSETIKLFDKAGEKLSAPKVLITVDGKRVRLSVAGERSAMPGAINVADVGPFGVADWYGRISRDGKFSPARAAANLPGLPEALKRFAAEPAKVASEHGKLTGSCSFCNRPLKDAKSLELGYGPVCAVRYGLPH